MQNREGHCGWQRSVSSRFFFRIWFTMLLVVPVVVAGARSVLQLWWTCVCVWRRKSGDRLPPPGQCTHVKFHNWTEHKHIGMAKTNVKMLSFCYVCVADIVPRSVLLSSKYTAILLPRLLYDTAIACCFFFLLLLLLICSASDLHLL